MDIKDPCGADVGVYFRLLQYGVNYTNKDGLRAATVTVVGYDKAISTLFMLQSFPSPIDLSDQDNATSMLITNHKKEEDITVHQYPLNLAILAQLDTMASSSSSMDNKKNLMFDMTCLGCFISPLVSGYAQTSSKKVDYHKYPSGNKVIKAFTANNFVFFDKAGNTLELIDDSCLDQAHRVRITWRIQKNRHNGQKITLSSEQIYHKTCPVCVLRARRLGQPDCMPVACYSYKGQLVYLTGKRIATFFCKAVKAIHPKTSKADLLRYLAHLLRVWACALLDEAEMSPEFIMSHLRWMGNSFRIYLRDTGIIQDKHRNTLQAVSQEVIDLIAGSLANIPDLAGLSIVPVDNTMGN